MDKMTATLHSTFSVNGEFSNKDTRFLNITIDVMHTGLNFNGSFFEKEIVDSCIDSIKNTAVLGFIRFNKTTQENDFKGHEHILTRTENGVEEKYIGRAYGVIPESCNPRWITKMCSDGKERDFLQVDALLWTKFDDSIDIVERDTEKGQSMELEISSVEGYEDDDGVFHFTKFRFDGCCILGEGVEPAMIDANVAINEVQFTMNDFLKGLQSELNDKFTAFTKLVNEKNQGGIETMPNTVQNTDFAQTVLQQFEDISTMVKEQETVTDNWGYSYPRYYAVDIQDSEVIVIDRSSGYNYFGFPFTMNGDKAEIDFTCGKRKKLCYEDYVEGTATLEGSFDFGKHIAEIESNAFAKIEDANNKVTKAEEEKATAETNYATVKENLDKIQAEYDEMKPKFDEYVKEENMRKEAEIEAQKDAEFAKYEDAIGECPEFAELKEKKGEMTVNEIESQCAIMYARKNLSQTNFARNNTNAMTAGVINNDDDGFVDTKYGRIAVARRK